jgi:hypothetical protein
VRHFARLPITCCAASMVCSAIWREVVSLPPTIVTSPSPATWIS